MKRLRYGSQPWKRFLAGLPRAGVPRPALAKAVARILAEVRRDGDAALVRLTQRLDGISLSERRLRVRPQELRALASRADRRLVAALREMAERIEAYLEGLREARIVVEKQEDPGSGDLLTGIITEFEKHAWVLRASLEA